MRKVMQALEEQNGLPREVTREPPEPTRLALNGSAPEGSVTPFQAHLLNDYGRSQTSGCRPWPQTFPDI